MNNKKALLLISIPTGVLLALLLFLRIPSSLFLSQEIKIPTSTPQIVTSSSYIWMSMEEIIKSADAIIEARVESISGTLWNSDDGEPWEPDFPEEISFSQYVPLDLQIHYITLFVKHDLLQHFNKGKEIEVVVLDNSPRDGFGASHDLEVGDHIIAFMQKNEIAWKGCKKQILQFISRPLNSYYKQGKDGNYFHVDGPTPISISDIFEMASEIRK
jgi:hypothetical protein